MIEEPCSSCKEAGVIKNGNYLCVAHGFTLKEGMILPFMCGYYRKK